MNASPKFPETSNHETSPVYEASPNHETSPVYEASPNHETSPVYEASPNHETSPKLASTSPELSNTSLEPSVSSVSDDMVQPHSSPSTKIVIDLNTYSNAESLGQENSSKKVCFVSMKYMYIHCIVYMYMWITLNLFHAESPPP